MKIVLAGATGFIGRALVKRLLEDRHQVVVLSRRVDAFKDIASPDLKVESWDGKTAGAWAFQLEGADAVVNLAGEGVADARWSAARKDVLRESRLNSTRALVAALCACRQKPSVLVNASAVGYYGDVPEGDVPESAPKGRGFLADLCAEGEAEAMKAAACGARVVTLRIGVVLEKDGGALKKFLPPFRFFVGGPLGSGRQYFPWVHRADVVGAIEHALKNRELSGPANVAAPGILTMKGFCSVLGRSLGRPSWAPVPGFALKLLLGEMAGMLLTGQKALPTRLEQTGYRFRYPDASSALADILRKQPPSSR